MNLLPTSRDELEKRGWKQLDIILISGDAYVDHPSFGISVIGRVLESKGFRVGIISMPDWKNPSSIESLGEPGLFFGVTGGAVDSMISKYTAFKRKRSDDPYTPGNTSCERPDRAIITYCNLIKKRFKNVPIVIGGIEASMRRIAHYDYWSNKVRRSIIEDSRADILVYGMGEQQIVEIARSFASGLKPENIPGTVILSKDIPENSVFLPGEEDVMNDKGSFSDMYSTFYRKQHRILVQKTGKRYLVHNPPPAENKKGIDNIFNLPFSRLPHISYKKPVPAFEMIKNSIISHRGCISDCSFCSLSLHQGRKIISRSKESIMNEVRMIVKGADFKGHITDIGGPSANMYQFDCSADWKCGRDSCLHPDLCKNIKFSTSKWINILGKASSVPGVKLVTVGSGIRYDLFMNDPESKHSLKTLVESHISGQLKIAPEHTSERVLRAMRKKPLYDLGDFIKKSEHLTILLFPEDLKGD